MSQTFHYEALRAYGELFAEKALHPERAEAEVAEVEEVEDVLQMGGDFTFDCRTGTVTYAYR